MLSLFEMKRLLTPKKESDPVSDFRIIDSWAEYDEKSTKNPDERNLEYLCYELEVMNPETGVCTHFYKAIKFARVIRLPADAKQSVAFMDMQEQVLTTVHENNYNLITVIANMIKPVALGLLYLYGVQGISRDLEEAKRIAHEDFLGYIAAMQGTFRVLEMKCAESQEIEWLRNKMYNMDYMTVVRGIPKANKAGENAGNKGMGGSNLNPDSQGTLEEIITGMVDYEYVIEVLSTPVYIDTLMGWQRQSQKEMTDWYGQLQGQKSLSMNLSIPMMYMANASQATGWSQAYTDASTVSYSQGESFSTSETQTFGQSLSESFGQTVGHTEGSSLTNSISQGVTESQGVSFGESFGQNSSVSQGLSVSHSDGTSAGASVSANEGTSSNYGINQGVSSNYGVNQSESSNYGISQNTGLSQGQNTSISQGYSQGSSYGLSYGENSSFSHNIGSSENIGYNQSESVNMSNSASYGTSASSSLSRGTSESYGYNESTSASQSTGYSLGTSEGTSTGTTHSNSTGASVGGSLSSNIPFVNGGVSTSVNGSVSNGSTTSENSSVSQSVNGSSSISESSGMSSNYGSSSSSSVTQGNSTSIGASQGYSTSAGTSLSYGANESYGTSTGNSLSQSWGTNESTNISQSTGQSVSLSNSLGESVSQGTSVGESISQGTSSGASVSAGTSSSLGYSENAGVNSSDSVSQNASVSNGTSYSQNVSNSYSVSQSQTLGQSLGQSISDSSSQSATQGYSESVSNGQSVSNGSNYSTSNGTSSGTSSGTTGTSSLGTSSSMGLGPSIGYSKSYQWLDQGVKDLLELMEYQNERLKKALRGQGAFYTYVYIACPTLDALSAAQALAKATWQNEFAMVQPLQVLNLTETEQKHLLYHFAAFSSDITREEVYGAEDYKYCTVLLPEEYVAYTHLPRVSEGGVFSIVQDIPKFSTPSMLRGEIYMGTVLNPERYSFNNGYRTPFDYRIDEATLMHGFFTGASRSGKTVAAMRFVAELSKVRRKKTGKRMRIVALDPKQDWRTLARFVEPERFNFYSLGNPNFCPVKINPWKVPRGVQPQVWIDGVIDIYCRAYGLLERGKQMIAQVVFGLYEEEGVFTACDKEDWKDLVPELSSHVTFQAVYKQMENERDKLTGAGKSGNDTKDAYARLLERLSCFSRPYSIESKLYGTSEGIGIDDMIGADDVTVLESKGLENTFKNFIFGVITSGFYKYAIASEGGYLADDQYETVLVIEEANEILTGNDAAGTGGGKDFGISGQSEFEQMLDQSAGYGLFIMAITQKIADMPSSIVANSGLVFAGKLKRTEDINVCVRAVAREERIDDRDLVKWFPRSPTGWFVCQTSRTFDFKDAEPCLVQISRLNINPPSNQELYEILMRKEASRSLQTA